MKRILYALLLAGATIQPAAAFDPFGPGVGLASNNRLVHYTDPARPLTFEGPFPISGVGEGQTLVALDVQPSTGVIYALGYNRTTGATQLYTINSRENTAVAVNQNPIRLRLGTAGSAGFRFDPSGDPSQTTIRVWGSQGMMYRLDANTGAITEMSNVQGSVATLDNPYTGTTFLADGTVRANGYVNADPQDAPPLLDAVRPGTQLSARLAPGAGGATAYLYPNPAVSLVRLVLSNAPRSAVSLEVVDLNGRLMNSRLYAPGTPEFDLDVSTLPIGLYAVRVLQDGALTDEIKLVRRSE